MSKYTPGPWEWDGEYPIRITNRFGYVVCSGLMPSQVYDTLLIAAAPDLLEALRKMVREFGYDAVHLNGLVHDERDAIISAMDAIRKATGE